MAYLVADIRNRKPQEGQLYLFDTNVWLAVLEDFYFRDDYSPYFNFFDSVVAGAASANPPRIAMTALLLSEVLNRVLHDVYFEDYKDNLKDIDERSYQYKSYRNTEQYKTDLRFVTESINQYRNSIELIPDDLNRYTTEDILHNLPSHLDFNDYIYTLIARKHGLVVVTHDTDFQVENVEIFTTKRKLRDLGK